MKTRIYLGWNVYHQDCMFPTQVYPTRKLAIERFLEDYGFDDFNQAKESGWMTRKVRVITQEERINL